MPVMSTLMACEEGMETEQALNEVLGMVDNYTLNGELLSLNRARMAPLAPVRRPAARPDVRPARESAADPPLAARIAPCPPSLAIPARTDPHSNSRILNARDDRKLATATYAAFDLEPYLQRRLAHSPGRRT
jgi:hypothetical protein